MKSIKIYERVDNLVYSRDFGSDPMVRQLDYIIGGSVTDYDRFEEIVKQIMAINQVTKPNEQPQTPTKSTIKPLGLKFKALALECGFIFWGDEPHGPGPDKIDWSCDYTEEFERYSRELVRWTCETMEQELTYASSLAAQKTYQHLAV